MKKPKYPKCIDFPNVKECKYCRFTNGKALFCDIVLQFNRMKVLKNEEIKNFFLTTVRYEPHIPYLRAVVEKYFDEYLPLLDKILILK